MPPNIRDEIPKSSLGIVPPPRRQKNATVDMWLEDKTAIDNAEGLWRVHDGIYDLTEFAERHPGGSQWIKLTKGLDITIAFEVHHLTSLPEETLKKFFVRKAKKKRNSPFTFKDDGFYRTLKREVVGVLPTVSKHQEKTTDFLIDAMLVLFFFLSTLAATYWNWFLALLAGMDLAILTISAHNYFHRKDNFRMYYFNFSLMTVREWRISHVLSHHMHTNTIDDYEMINWEPLLQYLPYEKSTFQKYGQWLIGPFMWMTSFHKSFFSRIKECIQYGKIDHMEYTDLVAFTPPLVMYIFSGQTFLGTLLMWTFIVVVASTHMNFVGLHAAHHHPEIFHDGDQPRDKEDYDWGISQLDAVMERKEITGSPFLVLTNFGDHALHHLFPTLDHATLEFLYPTFKKVMAEFNTNLRFVSQLDTIYGGYQQLIKDKPNQSPPELNKQEWLIHNYK